MKVGAETELVVCSPADLPAAVGGVITIPANTVVKICGTIDIGTNRIVFGTGACLIGLGRPVDILRSTSTGNAVSVSSNSEISHLAFQSPNGTALFVDAAGGDIALTNCQFNDCAQAAQIEDVEELTMGFVDILDCDQGIVFNGTVGLLYSNGVQFHAMRGTAVCVDFTATANITSGLFAAFWFDVDAGQTGLRVDGATTIGKGVLSGSSFVGAGTYTSPAPATLKADPRITLRNNVGVPDSTVRGAMAFTGNAGGVVTDIVTVNVFVPIGNNNPGTHPVFVLDANSERVSLQGATAPTQELRYTGLEIYNGLVEIALSVETPTLATGAVFSARLKVDGGVVANSTFQSITGGRVNAAGSLTFSVPIQLSTNQDLQIEIANNDDNSDLIVVACRVLLT